MPCRDDYPAIDYAAEAKRSLKDREAMLCAVLRVLEGNKTLGNVIDAIDWRTAGVSKMRLLTWWESHKEADRLRLLREKAENELKAKKTAALKKLTREEKDLLGIK